MNTSPYCLATALSIFALVMAVEPAVSAQSLLQFNGQVIAAEGLAVPGVPGAIFGGFGSLRTPVMDDNGTVLFSARMTGGGSGPANEYALCYGRSYSDLAMLARASDPTPGLPGLTLAAPSGAIVDPWPRISPAGTFFFGSDIGGPGVNATNDSGIFGGTAGSLVNFVREGDPAPGTVGATLASDMMWTNRPLTGINRNGSILLRSGTIGGDTTLNNNSGYFSGPPGSLQLVQRTGDILQGATVLLLENGAQLNDVGQVLHRVWLSTSVGPTPATSSNDRAMVIWTPGVGSQVIVREGDPTPGVPGASFNNASNQWSLAGAYNTFNGVGQAAFIAEFMGGGVTTGVNDRGLFVGGVAGPVLLARQGDPVPGINANLGFFNHSNLCLNRNGDVAFECILSGPSATGQDDTAIWVTRNGVVNLIARGGGLAPQTMGATFAGMFNVPLRFNDRGQVLFTANLRGGDVMPGGTNDRAMYAYDPDLGLIQVVREGDFVNLAPGLVGRVSGFGAVPESNSGGAHLGFNHNGDVVLLIDVIGATSTTRAIVRTHIGALWGFPEAISENAGGVHSFFLNGGSAFAGQPFLLAGSYSGTSPGIPLGTFILPLNPDPYFSISIKFPNIAPLSGSLGVLDAQGRATATATLPPGIMGLAGATFNHAFATVDMAGIVNLVSEPSRLLITQ